MIRKIFLVLFSFLLVSISFAQVQKIPLNQLSTNGAQIDYVVTYVGTNTIWKATPGVVVE